MLKGKLDLALIPTSSKQRRRKKKKGKKKKKAVQKIWGHIFRGFSQSVFINLLFAPASTLEHLCPHFLYAICGTDVGFIHSMQMQVLNWKMQMPWMIGKWSLPCMRPSWYSGPEYRFHRFNSNTKNTGMLLLLLLCYFLCLKERIAHLPKPRNVENSPYLAPFSLETNTGYI